MNIHQMAADAKGFALGAGQRCVRCGKVPGPKGGYIPTPIDKSAPGVRCGYCYRTYLKRYFPEALPHKRPRRDP